MNEKEKENVNLTAPCGMNCGICMAYLRKKNKCNGCREENPWKPKSREECKIKNCEIRNKEKLEYCFSCAQFPCLWIKNMDKRYRTRYGMSIIENLESIKEKGIDLFLRAEQEKWKCEVCGGVINVHKSECSSCGKPRKNV